MTAHAESSAEPVGTTSCWCCDGEYAETDVVRLGAHPEVAVCTGCAIYLKRRAVTKADTGRSGLGAQLRKGIGGIRKRVIERGWHERGLLGTALRRIDRHLP